MAHSPRESAADHDVKAEILNAASVLFQRYGYGKTKVAEIARAAGITPPTLYWHFESKEDILFEFLRSNLEEFLRRIDDAVAGCTDPVDKLRRLVAAHTRAQLDQLSLTQAFLSLTYSPAQLAMSLSNDRYQVIRKLHRRHLDHCRQIITEGVASGAFDVPDIGAATFAVLNISEYSALWFHLDGPLTAEQVADVNAEIAERIVTARPARA